MFIQHNKSLNPLCFIQNSDLFTILNLHTLYIYGRFAHKYNNEVFNKFQLEQFFNSFNEYHVYYLTQKKPIT